MKPLSTIADYEHGGLVMKCHCMYFVNVCIRIFKILVSDTTNLHCVIELNLKRVAST